MRVDILSLFGTPLIETHLTKQEVQALRDKHINLFLELLLHISLGHA